MRSTVIAGSRRTAAVAVLVVSLLFPLPAPAALANPYASTAAQAYGWGAPARAEDFTGDLAHGAYLVAVRTNRIDDAIDVLRDAGARNLREGDHGH